MTRVALRLGLLGLAGAALPIGVYLLAGRPAALAALARDEALLEGKERDLRVLEITVSKLGEFQADRSALDESLQLLDRIRPREAEVGPLVEHLRGIGTEYGLLVQEVKALPAQEASAPLELRLQGRYPALVSYVRRLPRLARLIRVDRVELERLEGPQFELRTRVTVFYWKG